jgi:hypothetical protein
MNLKKGKDANKIQEYLEKTLLGSAERFWLEICRLLSLFFLWVLGYRSRFSFMLRVVYSIHRCGDLRGCFCRDSRPCASAATCCGGCRSRSCLIGCIWWGRDRWDRVFIFGTGSGTRNSGHDENVVGVK